MTRIPIAFDTSGALHPEFVSETTQQLYRLVYGEQEDEETQQEIADWLSGGWYGEYETIDVGVLVGLWAFYDGSEPLTYEE